MAPAKADDNGPKVFMTFAVGDVAAQQELEAKFAKFEKFVSEKGTMYGLSTSDARELDETGIETMRDLYAGEMGEEAENVR
jgi:hypothetical protein